MKITIWSLTIEGDNVGIETSVYPTEKQAHDALREILELEAGCVNDKTPDAELSEIWCKEFDGPAIIEAHTIEIS